MTRDQSMVLLLVDQGVLSAADARKAPGKNVILQAVGLSPDVRVAIGRLELRRGDRLLLCSDGVTNQVTDDELRQIMTRSEPREACETMIALANERGGDDNETVIVADVLGEDLRETEEFETVTSTFEVLQAFEARPSKTRRNRMPQPAAGPKPAPPPAELLDDEPEIQVESEPDDELPPLDAAAAEPAADSEPGKRSSWEGDETEGVIHVSYPNGSSAEIAYRRSGGDLIVGGRKYARYGDGSSSKSSPY